MCEQPTIDDVERIAAKLSALKDRRSALDKAIEQVQHEYNITSIRANLTGPRHSGQIKDSNCMGSLEFIGITFHSDCDWQVYRCCRCGKKILTPSLGHNWAYDFDPAEQK